MITDGSREYSAASLSAAGHDEQPWLVNNSITARGSHPWGNPLRLLPWATAHFLERGSPLQSGDILTTGSWTGMEFAQPGDEIVARFPGVGEATVRFDAG